MLGTNGDLVAPETPNAMTEVKVGLALQDGKQTYYEKRIQLFEQFYAREMQKMEQAREAACPLKVTLPDGTKKEGIQNVTTPLDVAALVSKSLAKRSLVAKVDGQEWDLTRPLEKDCTLQLFGFEAPEGKEVGLFCMSKFTDLSLGILAFDVACSGSGNGVAAWCGFDSWATDRRGVLL